MLLLPSDIRRSPSTPQGQTRQSLLLGRTRNEAQPTAPAQQKALQIGFPQLPAKEEGLPDTQPTDQGCGVSVVPQPY